MEQNHLRAYEIKKPQLISMAREVAEYGVNWRGFKVGVAILVWRPKKGVSLTEKYAILRAANAKPIEGKRKFCAEMASTVYAHSNGFEVVIAIAIAAMPQADGGSGILSDVLDPCEECRIFLPAMPEVRPDTRILGIHNHNGTIRESLLEDILAKHGDPNPWKA